MRFHRPLLPNGCIAPIPWEIRLFFINCSWPIDENSSTLFRMYKRFIIVAVFFIFSYLNEAELHFIKENIKDIALVFELMPLYLVLVEAHFRIFGMVYSQEGFKDLIDMFYEKIYIENTQANRKIYRDIQRKLLSTKLCSYIYFPTLGTYIVVPIVGLFNNVRLLPYKTIFHYSFDHLYAYLPTLALTLWVGIAVVAHLVGESNLLAVYIVNLDTRFLLLQQELQDLEQKVNQDIKIRKENRFMEYRRRFVDIISRNVVYNEFAQKLQKQYSFSIFVMMFFSAALLCALGFNAVVLGMTSKTIGVVSWFICKTVELLVFGFLGSQLIETTDQMSTFYYSCNWENIILNSSDTRSNIELMKLIILAIELNEKPIYLTGYNFFCVRIPTVISILQGAFSYFTFLYAFR